MGLGVVLGVWEGSWGGVLEGVLGVSWGCPGRLEGFLWGLGVSRRVSQAFKFLCWMASVDSVPSAQIHTKTIGFPMVFVPFLPGAAAQRIATCSNSDQRT